MQTSQRKTSELKKKEKPKDDVPVPKKEEKLKKSLYTVSTPRNYAPKSSAADIYGKTNNVQSARAPKKIQSTSVKTSNVSPMKNLLKSSPSSVSQKSTARHEKKINTPKVEPRTSSYPTLKESKKKVPVSNITVNSPIVKRKLDLNVDKKESDVRNTPQRQRTKTRTLVDAEIKVLTPDVVDNNAEMLNLSRRLAANPKSFYIDLDGSTSKPAEQPRKDKSSDEEFNYEDDFDSYESDFESYHSESKSDGNGDDDATGDDEEEENENESKEEGDKVGSRLKVVKDEERMLDSGNFDLRDRLSASKMKPAMEFILETSELGDKKVSLTDEGFQEMSSSSNVSSMKAVHVDVLERPLFIDFTKAREKKRKRKTNERLKQRAKDLLSMITLHEMSYSLFEMKPISYDLYMATFGRANYSQIAVQTNDDSVSEDTQTDGITSGHKWTQHPVDFSSSDVGFNTDPNEKKYNTNEDNYLTKITYLLNEKQIDNVNNRINVDLNYIRNPLRVYLEQKDGVGSCEMLPYEYYKTKLGNNDYNLNRLKRFLKKFENIISNILTKNCGISEQTEFIKSSRFPFSKGYFSLTPKNISDSRMAFLKHSIISQIYYYERKSSLLITVHKNVPKMGEKRCALCLWDVSVARRDPIKILVAIDNIRIGKLQGNFDGLFVAALEDSSIHLWDLTEEPTWRGVANNENRTELVDIKADNRTAMENDREWNQQNCNVGLEQEYRAYALQACAFTTSGGNLGSADVTDTVVGLEVVGDSKKQDGCHRVLGQVISLQRLGFLTIWSIIQERSKNSEHYIGKAFWSKIRLEKSYYLSLLDHYDNAPRDIQHDSPIRFNLNAAKKRLIKRRSERSFIKDPFRAKTANSQFEFDRPISAASKRKVLPSEKYNLQHWDNVIVCNDLKVMRLDNVDNYLIAKNYGEVLCCRKHIGIVNIRRLTIANVTSSVTCVCVSPHNLQYFLAATDSGTVNLCSIIENRVLLTLDVRNVPITINMDRCQSDQKGRFVSSVKVRSTGSENVENTSAQVSITAILWSPVNPCYIFTLLQDGGVITWDLTHSDIYAKCVSYKAATAMSAAVNAMAILTPEGEVQIHRLDNEQRTQQHLDIFEKYLSLL